MNIKNIKKLRNALMRAKHDFNMGTSEFNPKCGSAGCIGEDQIYFDLDDKVQNSDKRIK